MTLPVQAPSPIRPTRLGALNLTQSFLTSLSNALSNGFTLVMLMIFLFVDVILFPGRLAWQAAHGSSYARRVGDFTGKPAAVYRRHGDHRHGSWRPEHRPVLPGGRAASRSCGACSPAFSTSSPLSASGSGLIPPAILTLLAYGPEPMLIMSAGVHSRQCHGAERDPATAGRDAPQSHALHEPALLHLLAAGAGTAWAPSLACR